MGDNNILSGWWQIYDQAMINFLNIVLLLFICFSNQILIYV